jgi:hypothetical protein
VVVVDEDVFAMLVDVEAFEVQAGHFTHPAPSALEQLVDEHRYLAAPIPKHPQGRHAALAGDSGEEFELSIELDNDAGRKRPAWWLFGNPLTAIAAAEAESGSQGGE